MGKGKDRKREREAQGNAVMAAMLATWTGCVPDDVRQDIDEATTRDRLDRVQRGDEEDARHARRRAQERLEAERLVQDAREEAPKPSLPRRRPLTPHEKVRLSIELKEREAAAREERERRAQLAARAGRPRTSEYLPSTWNPNQDLGDPG